MRDELVGRAAELATVRRVLGDAAAPAVVAVTGDPGIGKTRLLTELGTMATGRSRLVITGGATEFERHLPFGALVESLDGWLRAEERGSARFRGAVGELLGKLSAAPDAEPPAWFGLHRRIRTVLEELAQPRGLVLVLDDLHWADDALIELVGYLLRRPPRGRFVLALGYRPRQVDRRVEEAIHGAPAGLVEWLPLGPLSAGDSDLLLGSGVSKGIRESLVRDSGGNPLFLKALRQAGATTPGQLPGLDDDLPAAVQAALLSEIRGLPVAALAAVQAAAVAGDPFEYGLVAAIAGMVEGDAVRMIDELVKRDLVRQAGPAPRFGFRHPLLRRLVYTTMPAGARRDAHRRAAAALRRHGTAAATLAHHVARSAAHGDVDAAHLLADAARSTLWQAPGTSAWLLEESLRLLPANPDTAPDRQRRTLLLARALVLTGRLRDGRHTAHALLAELPDDQPESRAEAAILTATADRLLGHHDRARAVLLGELDRPRDHPETACSIRLELVTGGLLAGDFSPREAEILDAVSAAERTADRSLVAAAAAVQVFTSYATGRYPDALARLDPAAQLVDALPDTELGRRLDTAVWLAWAEIFLERFHRAIAHFDRALTLIRATGQGHLLTYVLVGMSQAYLQIGRFTEAAEWASDAVEAAELSTSDELRTMAYTLHCLAATHLADLETALDAGARAVTAAGPVSDWWAATAGILLGQARLAAGTDPARCLDDMLCAGGGPDLPAMDPGNRPYFYEPLVHAELARGDPTAALAWVDRMDQAVAQLGPAAHYRAGMAQLLRAEITLTAGDPRDALPNARHALAAFTAAGAHFFAGRAHLAAGRALTAAGDRGPGLTHLRRAQEIFTELGAHRHIDAAVHSQRQQGHRAARAGSPAPSTLTRRETQIAQLITQGRTNRQIAQHLFISDRTVETHIRNICTKLQVPSRTAIAATIARHDQTG